MRLTLALRVVVGKREIILCQAETWCVFQSCLLCKSHILFLSSSIKPKDEELTNQIFFSCFQSFPELAGKPEKFSVCHLPEWVSLKMKIYLRYPPCHDNILNGIFLWKAYCGIIGPCVSYQRLVAAIPSWWIFSFKKESREKVKKVGREGKMESRRKRLQFQYTERKMWRLSCVCDQYTITYNKVCAIQILLVGSLHEIYLQEVFYLAIGIHSKFVFSVCKVEEGQLGLLSVSWHGSVSRRKKWWVG